MSKRVVITGANRGIGLQLCTQYLALGFSVIAIVRQSSSELEQLKGVRILSGVDMSNMTDIERLGEKLKGEEVDILINNAGIFSNETLANMDFSAIEQQIQINAIAPVSVTHALLSNLKAGSKVAMVTSRMGSISDNGSGAYIGYRMSKAALNAAGVSLAHELKSRGVAVGLLHPGFVQTAMVNYAGDISPELSAQRLIERIDELNMDNTGGFWHSNGESLPW